LTARRDRVGAGPGLGASRRFGPVVTLAAGVLSLGVTGCSHGYALGPKGPAIYEATISAGTARVWVYLNVHAPRATTYILAEGETNLSNGESALGVQAGGVTTNELFTRNDLYFQVPQEARATNGRKPWEEVVFRGAARRGPGEAAGSAVTGPALADVDPAPLLGVLAEQPERSVFVGSALIGGKPASEYRFDLRTAAVVGPAPGTRGETGAGVIGLIAGLPHPGEAVLPVYVWLDSAGRAVQLAASATLETEPADPSALQAALANELPATVSVRVDLGNFGERFTLEAPPLGEVSRVPVSQLQAGVL
jgi:hypothetical protein